MGTRVLWISCRETRVWSGLKGETRPKRQPWLLYDGVSCRVLWGLRGVVELSYISVCVSHKIPFKISDLVIPCAAWSFLLVLIPSVGASSIIVSGGFSVSRGVRLWETDLPNLLIFDDALVWTFSNCVRPQKTHLSSSRIITTCNLWILICFLNSRQIMLSARLCTLTTPKAECHLHMHSTENRRWYNVAYLSCGLGNALHDFLSYLEAIKNRHISTSYWCSLCDGMMRLWFCVCNASPRKFSTRPIYDSLMELGQSTTSTTYSRFPEACLKRRNSCDPTYFGALPLVLSGRKLSCEQFSSSLLLTTFTTHSFSVNWCIMMA